MREEMLETEAVELPEGEDEQVNEAVRPLPVPASETAVTVWSGEVKTAAIAAAGGLVAGAATVAVVRATRAAASPKRRRRGLLGKERPQQVVASRSFLVDVHLLGSK